MPGAATAKRCVTAVGACLLAFSWASAGQAAESTKLWYVRAGGAEQCPDEGALRMAVAVRLGYDPFVAWARTTIVAQIAREGAKLRARVYLADDHGKAHGSREFTGSLDDCTKLVAAMSLAISIAIDPMSASAAGVAPSEALPAEKLADEKPGELPPGEERDAQPRALPPVPGLPAVAPLAPRPASEKAEGVAENASTKTTSPIEVHAGVGALVATGFAPAFNTGGMVFARLDIRDISFGAEGRYDLAAGADATVGRSRVESKSWMVSLVPCFRVRPAFFCGLGSAGVLHGAGSGVSLPQEQSATYFGVGGRAALELPIASPFAVRAHADLLGNLTRVTLAIEQQPVWQAPLFAAVVGLDVVARIW